MTDQEPQLPVNPEPTHIPEVQSVKPAGGSKHKRFGLLEGLPDDVKTDMENHMHTVNVASTKAYVVEKYGDRFPLLKEITKTAFYYYFKRHKIGISKDLELQRQSAPVPVEILDVIEAITDHSISLEDKRKALTALFNSCQARGKILEARNSTFIDPQIEMLLLQNTKEQHAILKTVATLNDQLTKDADRDWLDEASILIQVVLAAVSNSYRLVNGDTNFSLFNSILDQKLTEVLKQYRLEKEKLKTSKN